MDCDGSKPLWIVQGTRDRSLGRERDQFLEAIDGNEAASRFHAVLNVSPLGGETVPLADAFGRVLAESFVIATLCLSKVPCA